MIGRRVGLDAMEAARRVLVAPDSFKGTFSAVEVAAAIARGLERGGVTADPCPVADGGEGTLEVLIAALGGEVVRVPVCGPLGDPVEGELALLGGTGRRALLEMASASGLALVSEAERDPWTATTYGTGQLIRAAVDAGAREVLVGVGGSATVDGGRGALDAIAAAGGLGGATVVVLCDVQTPWERSAAIYGPQKGADSALVARLAERLDEYAAELPRDPRGVPMTGAAGGLSGGLWAGLGASLEPGAPYVLDAVGFSDRLRAACCAVVGEGRIDVQSAMGKIVGEICARAAAHGVPVHAVVGRNELDAATAGEIGLQSVTEATDLAEMEAAGERLAAAPARTTST
jgi:glycerate kinase